jgi:hypothetical protein
MSDKTGSVLSKHTAATSISNSIPGFQSIQPPPHLVHDSSASGSDHPENPDAPVEAGGDFADLPPDGPASESDQRPATASSHGSVFGSGRSPLVP